ncbi:ferredoxin--NADP reductase [Shewanella psychrotolerans]|uniref:ferredoxin--NADP reductase n=1 Tax=Shewanella psychrotolerans TaxID=2864206 RepID=UPI001C655C7F|nr:ferredoxin--NADP reductase [Shewanella psychrotolerans]QYK02145.1 ferredoxin--NADP reductase [Shewanella psychrotolerans]
MWGEARVVERIDWNDQLFTLKLSADIGDFIAGQFIKLSQHIEGKRVARAYSLVNAPSSDFVEVLAINVEGGMLSPNLQALKVGDRIDISTKAAGFMTLDELPNQGRHLWLFATGTAVGPFISMMRTAQPWSRFEKVILVYGVRHADDLAYFEELKSFKSLYPGQFELVTSVTREPYEGAINMRIPQGMLSGVIEAQIGVKLTAEDAQVMICGHPEMIKELNQLLLERGLAKNLRRAPGQITVEKYW